jgi:hypothetical protein
MNIKIGKIETEIDELYNFFKVYRVVKECDVPKNLRSMPDYHKFIGILENAKLIEVREPFFEKHRTIVFTGGIKNG